MIREALTILLMTAAFGAGIAAGIFFAFSTFVMKALARLPAQEGIRAMQSINDAVLNPLFASVFAGTAAAGILALVLSFLHGASLETMYAAIGLISYVAGVILVTMRRNVPLNERLAAWNPEDGAPESIWNNYVSDWSRWNHLRTVAASVSMVFMMLAARL